MSAVQVAAHGGRRLVEEAVVEPLVVAVVEAELLELPLEIPVGLGGEQHVGMDGSDGGDDVGPVLGVGHRTGPFAPGAAEHVVEHEHRHVAAHAVGEAADVDERVDGGLSEPGGEGVELGDVGPWREVGVAPAGDHGVADGEELVGCSRQVVGVAEDEVLGMGGQPGVVGGDVVGNEVDDEPGASCGECLAGRQRGRRVRRSGRRRRSGGCSRRTRSRRLVGSRRGWLGSRRGGTASRARGGLLRGCGPRRPSARRHRSRLA